MACMVWNWLSVLVFDEVDDGFISSITEWASKNRELHGCTICPVHWWSWCLRSDHTNGQHRVLQLLWYGPNGSESAILIWGDTSKFDNQHFIWQIWETDSHQVETLGNTFVGPNAADIIFEVWASGRCWWNLWCCFIGEMSTLPKTNSSTLKSYHLPKGNHRRPTPHVSSFFRGELFIFGYIAKQSSL